MIALRNGGDFQACGLAFVNSDAPFLEADFNRRSFSAALSNGYPPPSAWQGQTRLFQVSSWTILLKD